jgi:hypothetical protein
MHAPDRQTGALSPAQAGARHESGFEYHDIDTVGVRDSGALQHRIKPYRRGHPQYAAKYVLVAGV